MGRGGGGLGKPGIITVQSVEEICWALNASSSHTLNALTCLSVALRTHGLKWRKTLSLLTEYASASIRNVSFFGLAASRPNIGASIIR